MAEKTGSAPKAVTSTSLALGILTARPGGSRGRGARPRVRRTPGGGVGGLTHRGMKGPLPACDSAVGAGGSFLGTREPQQALSELYKPPASKLLAEICVPSPIFTSLALLI